MPQRGSRFLKRCQSRVIGGYRPDVPVDYDRAFRKVILNRWDKTPVEQRQKAMIPNRQGQLAPNDPISYALYDSYNYQRGHADVFREVFKQVYKKAALAPPRKGERLLVVDIGAGAATVAVALGEALKRGKRQRIDYLAFDPHPMMRKLGKRILKHLDTGFRSANYIKSLEDVDFTDTDRLLFTFSYVTHQNALEDTDTTEWASLIKRAVNELDQAAELIYTTAGLSGGALIDLKQELRRAKIRGRHNTVGVQVRRRFPGPVGSDSQICWDEQSKLWQVQAEHWMLST